MVNFLIVVHVLTCLLLLLVILMQAGRGGGLTEAFASAETMFGAQTSGFLVRTTAILVAIFISTSLALAFLSAKKEKSLMESSDLKEKIKIPVNAAVETPSVPPVIELPSNKQNSKSPIAVDDAKGRFGVGMEKLNNAVTTNTAL